MNVGGESLSKKFEMCTLFMIMLGLFFPHLPEKFVVVEKRTDQCIS